ncbi:MAG: DUF924 domain-containing protein [Rhodospirillales bacterium]|nr:DUF924 domain-containing protein [Rhodospirillales bacterium]
MTDLPTPGAVLEFWFGTDPIVWRPAWFGKDAGLDAACAAYAEAIYAARAGDLDDWAETPHGALALVILLDQMPRNLFRGSAEAFVADPHALAIARIALARGFDAMLDPIARVFLYLPLEHAEDPAEQDRSVRLFEALPPIEGARVVHFARRHRDVVRRFGRYPHRNAALGRVSTPDELAYLAEPDAGF